MCWIWRIRTRGCVPWGWGCSASWWRSHCVGTTVRRLPLCERSFMLLDFVTLRAILCMVTSVMLLWQIVKLFSCQFAVIFVQFLFRCSLSLSLTASTLSQSSIEPLPHQTFVRTHCRRGHGGDRCSKARFVVAGSMLAMAIRIIFVTPYIYVTVYVHMSFVLCVPSAP